MTNNNAILLLSGGLDSLVSIALTHKTYNIIKAIHFDYKQAPETKELVACKKICEHYGFDLQVVELPWLGELAQNSALCTSSQQNDTKSYWIPNRNGLFVNIAASFAETLDCKYILIGANAQEAKVFKDNSIEFVNQASEFFTTSTQNSVELIAPLIEMDKNEIIQKALELNTPLELVWSCYTNGDKHCGKCPSCILLKNALVSNNKQDLQKLLF